MGLLSTDYAQLREKISPEKWYGSQGAGMSHSAGVGRISYLFGFEGPSLAIDTASSSSLAAVCQAVRGLRNGECDVALAGGANAILSPVNSILLCRGGVLSPDGRCKSFSANADGFGRGEGCGVIVLKRLSDAQREGDRILGVIRGTAITHNGQSGGLTAPKGKAQEEMIRRALAESGFQPSGVDYLEAHATGTELGDPIEVNAAARVLGAGRNGNGSLLLGSAKANLSHLEAAGGIAGLIKTVLAMQNGFIPGQLNFQTPSAHVPWEDLPLQVVTEPTSWPEGKPPVAGVSALGMTGTNAHVIVEGYERAELPVQASEHPKVLTISAKTESALRELAKRYEKALAKVEQNDFENFCRQSQQTRRHFDHCIAIMAQTPEEAREHLANGAESGQVYGTKISDQAAELAQQFINGELATANTPEVSQTPKHPLPAYPFQRKKYWLDLA